MARPIVRQRIGGFTADKELRNARIQAAHERDLDAMLAKLPALAAAHGVPVGNWLQLVLALAQEHVPGFRLVGRAGRPISWSQFERFRFHEDVDQLRQSNPKLTVTEAIRRGARLPAWSTKTKGMKIEALKQHYYKVERLKRAAEMEERDP